MTSASNASGHRGPSFFRMWALFGIVAPLVGVAVFGLELRTTAFIAVGGFVGPAVVATLLNWRQAIAGARWSADAGSLGDMSGGE